MVAAEYRTPAVRNLIWQLKYNSVRDISQTIALVMADFIIKNDLADYFAQSTIIAVPTHKKRLRFRGFNQAEEISRHFAASLGLEYCEALVKSKPTTRQVDLQKNERLENLKGVFEPYTSLQTEKVLGKKIILVDDVATTGTTLNECALALQKLEPAEIWGLVVARN
ncbi:MAG: hypothetical protein A2751_05785 [Candidatus Doudnabacteria bacterium RIFCSPHIGHO2_01_FULL_46_14]|uniref:Phosphoribosyltransferase domain-containing protein n=1 Tax=Candidatus Doudnabacteria bacterium RIFCSPHIGHO2_01_FULL_46_14 TaxID=1817824 RepID=A0A1F5NNH8_9BACT|nr:MAG: hypothetical protein A2751_05785 [Candidatus Doudnabacteria bacterium RIFCSPHIGHO2_01_FULL_46_14]